MEYDLTADTEIVHLPDSFVFNVGDRVTRRRRDGTIDTFIVVPHSGTCSGCDFPYHSKELSWDICLPNPGYGVKMCDMWARGGPSIMFKSIDKVLEEI